MIDQVQLENLCSFESDGEKVISVYLDTDTAKESSESIKSQLKGMLRDAQLQATPDAENIERYLDLSYDWSTPGLTLFSCAAADFFQTFPTAVSFRNRLRIGPKPYIKPLAHLLDYYANYGAILVDKIGARFFKYHQGELQATDGYLGEDIRKLKQGRGSSAVGMRGGVGGARRENEAGNRNMREAAAAAASFFNKWPVRRLFIGGTVETVASFSELLPKQLQSCVADTFVMDMNAGEHEVRQQVLLLLEETNAKREEKMVESLINAIGQNGNAVVGLDETLQAVNHRRVQTLIISDGFRAPGYFDENAGFVVANLAQSPMAADELIPVDDVVDLAMNLTISNGGQAEVVTGNENLEEYGRIGALLRY